MFLTALVAALNASPAQPVDTWWVCKARSLSGQVYVGRAELRADAEADALQECQKEHFWCYSTECSND